VTEAAAMAAAAMAAARAAVMMVLGLAEEVRAVVKVVEATAAVVNMGETARADGCTEV
jgi:hypothetical protein